MSLIDNTYFIRDISLPIKTGGLDDTSAALTRYEPEILEHLLGYSLAKLVLAYVNPGSEQRIIDIVEGKEYTYGSYTVNWNGLKNTEKVSILSYYTYIEYLKDHSINFQGASAVAANVENGVNVGPSALIQRASLALRQLAGYYGQDVYAPSLYNFLKAYESTYPELIWKEYKPVNALGI